MFFPRRVIFSNPSSALLEEVTDAASGLVRRTCFSYLPVDSLLALVQATGCAEIAASSRSLALELWLPVERP